MVKHISKVIATRGNRPSSFIVDGGHALEGTIAVGGAKNSVLKILAASVLYEKPLTITNVPLIEDVFRMIELLEHAGATVERVGEHEFRIDASGIRNHELHPEIAKCFRGSIVLVAPLLVRLGRVTFPHPGGCVIGARPIDLFLKGWISMGARVTKGPEEYDISLTAPRGTEYMFRHISVTGTEALMLTAVVAHGTTILMNAACEPEIPHLAEFLNQSGARIEGAGTHTIKITGTGGTLLQPPAPFSVLPDRIEAASFLLLGAALGKNITITDCVPDHVRSLIEVLREAGVSVHIAGTSMVVRKPKMLRSISVRTHEYPGFVTDFQAPFAVLMTQAHGQSTIFETIFDGRFHYIEDLNRMGAHITIHNPHRIAVEGPTALRGREIESPDLRAGLGFVLAALIADGRSTINTIYFIDRGYECIDARLRSLGAFIERV
ncbi:MAG TPA: UDP-N-acetylglucosamine 1-carboxyvinyltransferase [Candidatus Paceibacterota bacterium]